MSAADILRYRLECYLAALSLVGCSRSEEISVLQGRARAMRMLLDIGVSVRTGLR